MTGPSASVAVAMSDGARIALSVWHPEGRPLPVVLQFTEYWRYPADSPTAAAIDEVAAAFLRDGYAYATVDVRGSGASTGVRDGIFTPRVRQDLAEVIRWTAAQPFCDGDVFSYGISNAGTFAEWVALSGEPAVRGVAMLYSDFDLFGDTFQPGGVETTALTSIWQPVMSVRDGILAADDPSVPAELRDKAALFAAGVLRVDDDHDGRMLAAAIDDHRSNIDLREAAAALQFRDDPFGTAEHGLDEASTFGHYAPGEAHTVPQLVIASWRDAATARGALARFTASSGPMRVDLTPWGHGGHEPGDPFGAEAGAPIPVAERIHAIAAFFDGCRAGSAGDRGIRYYELGSGRWRETAAWPGGSTVAYGVDGAGLHAPGGADALVVDGDAATGELTRWRTQVTGCAVDYTAFEDATRPGLESAPLASELVLAGTPRVRTVIEPLADDVAVFAYLEAVDPDGRAHLLTDGQLRVRSRRVRSDGDGLDALGASQTLRRVDVDPVVVGAPTEVVVDLLPVAARLEAGSRIRLSFAASDTASFARVPATGPTGYRVLTARTRLDLEVE